MRDFKNLCSTSDACKDAIYTTVFREPVTRAVSNYNYIKHHQRIHKNKMDPSFSAKPLWNSSFRVNNCQEFFNHNVILPYLQKFSTVYFYDETLQEYLDNQSNGPW